MVVVSVGVVVLKLKFAGVTSAAAAVAGTGKLCKLLLGQQQSPPKDLNTPPIAFVETIVEYLVLVLIAQAVICEQSQRTNG